MNHDLVVLTLMLGFPLELKSNIERLGDSF